MIIRRQQQRILRNFTKIGQVSSIYHRSFASKNNSKVLVLTLYTGKDCQLCDIAKGIIEEVSREVSG